MPCDTPSLQSRLWPGDRNAAPVIDKDKKRCDPIYVSESSTAAMGDGNDSWDCNFERER